MKRFIPLVLAVASTAVLASSAFAQSRDGIPASNAAAQADVQAQQAAVQNDWQAVATLAARSYRESPSLSNEFNLANAYVRTGQTALAVPLYADIAENGQFSKAFALYDYRHGAKVNRASFNYADEANRRLAQLTGEPVAPSRYASTEVISQ